MAYVTWEQYIVLHDAIMDEQEFVRLSKKAEAWLNAVTHIRAKRFECTYDEETATDFQKQVHQQIQDTFCQLVDLIAVQEHTDVGTGVVSVSNDGYSESYQITTVEEKEKQFVALIRAGLSGTGLAGAL